MLCHLQSSVGFSMFVYLKIADFACVNISEEPYSSVSYLWVFLTRS